MLFRSLIAFAVLIAWPFAASVPASSPHVADGHEVNPPAWLWVDPRPLAPAADQAAETQVFEQTLLHTIGLLLPLSDKANAAVAQAAAAFSARQPILLRINKFTSGSPDFEFVSGARPPAAESILAHRKWVDAQRGAESSTTKSVLELFIDVDSLRRGFEDDFSTGRAGRVIHALGVPNARTLMLHGQWIDPAAVPFADPQLPLPASARRPGEYAKLHGPPIVRLDFSWNSRSDDPAVIRGMNIAAGHWPGAQLQMTPPAAPFLCVFRATWQLWIVRALQIRSGWLEPADCDAFDRAATTWVRGNRPAIERIIGAVPSWLLLHPSDRHADWLIAETPTRSENVKPLSIVGEVEQLMRAQFAGNFIDVPNTGSRLAMPPDGPLVAIGWNPAPNPPAPTVQFRIELRGGKPAK